MSLFFDKKVLVRDVINFFDFEQITGNDEALNRWIVVPDINRPGFELSGYFKLTEPRRIVLIGNKEIEYISHLTDAEQYERYPKITDALTPMMIVTHNNPVPPILVEVAEKQNFPIFRTRLDTYRLTVDLISYLEEKMAPEDTLSAVLMVVYGKGVLLMGESGIGKSEAALELIGDGMAMVADDRVDVERVHNTIIGHAPELLKGMLEIRGIGIIDVMRMFGANSLTDKHTIDLVIDLRHYDGTQEYNRLESSADYYRILGISIPKIILPVSPGRSTKALIESAVTNFILLEEGYDSSAHFRSRIYEHLLSENAKNQGENK
ncbi:MAG: HPr(Ser) kinase/phosphatase [Solobacterium sp.]|nr:HPr(Ser) kinase/phosphatase [Solobacterium sp.]